MSVEGAGAFGSSRQEANSMRVLLIEDEPTTAKAIELMLTNEGFNVYTTDLGEEGLDLGKLYDYDIICLDLNLPDMHGYDVLKKLRTAKVGTPVLILSGVAEMDSKVRALGFGADDYVTKPMFLNHLHGGMGEPELKFIDVFICKLRKKLSLACGGDNYIETVWGRGYVLREPEEGQAAQVA